MMNAASIYPHLSRHQRNQVNSQLSRLERAQPARARNAREWENQLVLLGIPLEVEHAG